jgi:hypothetical protein
VQYKSRDDDPYLRENIEQRAGVYQNPLDRFRPKPLNKKQNRMGEL